MDKQKNELIEHKGSANISRDHISSKTYKKKLLLSTNRSLEKKWLV